MQGTFFFGVLPSKYSGSVAGLQYGRGKVKLFLREERIYFASTDFFKTAGFEFPPRRRVREECAAGCIKKK